MFVKFSVWKVGGDTSNLGSKASTTGCTIEQAKINPRYCTSNKYQHILANSMFKIHDKQAGTSWDGTMKE